MILPENILRWLYALYYYACGLGISLLLFGTVTIDAKVDFGVGVNNLLMFMQDTGFLLELLGLSYFTGSLLLIIDRTAPLGLIVLAPAVVVIFFTHWCVEDGNPAWGTANALVLLGLVWRYRRAYFPLFNFSNEDSL